MCHPSRASDINTNSNYHDVVTRHTELRLAIDFDRKIVSGTTVMTLESISDEGLDIVTLDTCFLTILSADISGSPVRWELGQTTDQNGQPLLIRLGPAYAKSEIFQLTIRFETTAQCTGLQWFNPEQTDDKLYPFMFSQAEPVHARSIFPCLDTPSVKTTFDIVVTSPLPVVASGVPEHDLLFPPVCSMSETNEYKFKQEIPISNYLFGLASGNLAGAKIGATSYVYSTPADLELCVAEFQPDIQAIIDAAENLIFTNPWPLYNLVVLPKSFHLGGMENPIFNFYSATVVSGDRANISVVAHEFAHTFSGNLVTNASWEHFWLNEGWTVYTEREVLRRIRGSSEATFEAIVGWNELVYGIEAYGGSESPETCLVLQFQGKRPDDVMSKISYEKGYTFLCFLEQTVGRAKWLTFVPHYFQKFSRATVDSEAFKAALYEFFAEDAAAVAALNSVDWHNWYHKPGLPPKPDFHSPKYDDCVGLAAKWRRLTSSSDFQPCAADVENWTAGQLLVFLDSLLEAPEPITVEPSRLLGSLYCLRQSKNFEVLSRYLRIGLRAKDVSLLDNVEEFLGQTGRMKFVRPLFESLQSVDHEFARKVFAKYENFYHPTCLRLLRRVLSIQ
ncbi:peptidase family M1-domain-containing protein [Thelonectria olida]|uniref:Peptidase family M1-domain-containing protein n=1 Tax=Thelonectria olida TaxID=1576542 RepID=A0A9P9ALX1_9HYPO|nr:peptidase family M1-domain-containing protein [Thelonectria olida]